MYVAFERVKYVYGKLELYDHCGALICSFLFCSYENTSVVTSQALVSSHAFL